MHEGGEAITGSVKMGRERRKKESSQNNHQILPTFESFSMQAAAAAQSFEDNAISQVANAFSTDFNFKKRAKMRNVEDPEGAAPGKRSHTMASM